MKILFYDDVLYSISNLQNKILTKENIDGIVINTVMTKDGKFIIVSFGTSESIIQEIENYTYEEAKKSTIVLLEEVLKICCPMNKRLLIHAYISPTLLNYKDIESYTTNLSNIINKYAFKNIDVFSYSYPLITYLKPKLKTTKVGILLNPKNTSFIDVDFYIYPPVLLSPIILNQEYKRGKEIMVILATWSDLNQMNKFFTEPSNKSQLSKELIDSISVLTKYPSITYNTIKNI